MSLRAGWLPACLLLLLAGPVVAAANDKNDNGFPQDFAANPALAALNAAGAKFYYMGRTVDMDQWLAVKDGQTQVIYKPVNNAYVLIGNFFAPNGQHLSLAQIKNLAPANKELASFAAVDAPPTLAIPPQDEPSPGEQLMKDLSQKANGVTLGGNNKAPQIFVIAMPGCRECAAFWQAFRDPVQKGTVRLRLIPVAQNNNDQEHAAAHLLAVADPVALWDQDTKGVADAAAATVDPKLIEQVRANTALGERWQIPVVPYLVYRDSSGAIKVVQGAPARAQDILDDITPEKPDAEPMSAKP